jgi:hypothetical protein
MPGQGHAEEDVGSKGRSWADAAGLQAATCGHDLWTKTADDSPTPAEGSDNAADGKLARQLFAYEMLAARRNQQDSMLWQAPALALTAQAFLLTIALGGNAASVFARALAAGLGLVVACMSMQLMHYSSDIAKSVCIVALSNLRHGRARGGLAQCAHGL